MKNFFKPLVFSFIMLSLYPAGASVFGEDAVSDPDNILTEGYKAYSRGDWADALFLLRKGVALPEGRTEHTYFLLIMSEMFAEDYESAVADCAVFESLFPGSLYMPYIMYQYGRALHETGRNAEAVERLVGFCALYPNHELYAASLFWIAESFYSEYSYEPAKALYERIVADYSLDPKALDSRYRLETIGQREREEKLLYLLKVTGEEYLAAKENYEKQLRQYQTEEIIDLRRKLKTAEDMLSVRENELKNLESLYAQRNDSVSPDVQPDMFAGDVIKEELPAAAEKTMPDERRDVTLEENYRKLKQLLEELDRQKEEELSAGMSDEAL